MRRNKEMQVQQVKMQANSRGGLELCRVPHRVGWADFI